jgi:hypothetical protein
MCDNILTQRLTETKNYTPHHAAFRTGFCAFMAILKVALITSPEGVTHCPTVDQCHDDSFMAVCV